MDEAQRKYITSERFIHDDLLQRSQQVIDEVCRLWRMGEKVPSYALTWPTKTVRADNGVPLNDAVIMEMPEEREWKVALVALIERTEAYGLLLIDMSESQINAVFESNHGSRRWIIPVERHGDRLVLGNQSTKDDAEALGLLWSPKKGNA